MDSGLDVLQKLLEEGPDRRLQRRCLAILAELCGAGRLDLESARFALQQVLDGMFWPIKRQGQAAQDTRLFQECLDLALDIADSQGIFAGCYELITPALAASAIQQLLEIIDSHPTRKSEMLQLLSREFSQKVRGHPCASQPLTAITAWVEWSGDASGTSSLPFLLYSAFRTEVGRRLLELHDENGSYKVHAVEELHREQGLHHQDGAVFAAVRRAARHHLLIEAVADRVARRQMTAAEARRMLDYLGGASAEDPDPASLLFFHSLVLHAGSMAAAGKALEVLLQTSGCGEGSVLRAWAAALAKPENAAAGPGTVRSQ